MIVSDTERPFGFLDAKKFLRLENGSHVINLPILKVQTNYQSAYKKSFLDTK